ncbi:MAG: hypothetical protein QOH58_2659 [Thermoleophilaceae bacterium]|jgi:hypothetical protein|nr:hypothetical protein [Thermoleophilaceae bacterium]
MNASTRHYAAGKLAGFAALLVLVFGAAVAAGGAIGPERDGEAAAGADAMSAHGTDETAADPVRGLAVSEGGLELELEQADLERGRATELRFSIVGSDGQPVRAFQVEHEKRMHLIVVRRDGEGFQHLHPELGADGLWRVRLTLPDAGSYRVFADFKYRGEAHTLAADVAVDGEADYRPLPAPQTAADTGDGYRVRLDADALEAGSESELRFGVTRDGEAVRTDPYLGAGGHLVALREGDLAYLHVHPEGHGKAVSFMTEFPSEGRYRLYLQFKHEGRVHTAEFTQEVAR